MTTTLYDPRSTPCIVITGPTASGKSALALDIAERYGGEIICADSRTIYRGMDIGTAKPTANDQARVRHHLLDVAAPDERFTAADFKRLATQAISDICARGNIPFIVGGTGLYIDSVILDYHFGSDVDMATRSRYQQLSMEELRTMLKKQRIPLPDNNANKRYLVRALEQKGINNNRKHKPHKNVIVVAIATEKHELEARIRQRAEVIFDDGIVDEATALAAMYGWDHESMSGNIYPIIRRFAEGAISLNEAKELFVAKDRQLAKRQITWLKRHDFVTWLSIAEARRHLETLLATHADTTMQPDANNVLK